MVQRPTLETERLVLRPLTLADAPAVRELAGDWQIADMTLNIPHPYEEGMAEAWIGTHEESFVDGKEVAFAMARRDDKQLLGCISLMRTPRFDRAEIGYWVGVPYWGQGYGTEAARAIVDYGFRELELNKIVGRHLVRNPASGRVMAKVGLVPEGILRQHIKKWGVYEDLVTCGLLRCEWEAARSST